MHHDIAHPKDYMPHGGRCDTPTRKSTNVSRESLEREDALSADVPHEIHRAFLVDAECIPQRKPVHNNIGRLAEFDLTGINRWI